MKALNNYLNLITLAALCLSVYICSGCVKAATPGRLDKTFLPGECLKSTNLIFVGQGKYNGDHTVHRMTLSFQLDLDSKRETVDYLGHYESVYRYAPSDDIFTQFGDNASLVSKLYEDAWQAVTLNFEPHDAGTTVFYDSGMSLIANKDFAGVKAGENIAANHSMLSQKPNPFELSGFRPYPSDLSTKYSSLKFDDSISYNYRLAASFSFVIDDTAFTWVDENVTFTLSIPVKVGLYLTWLNDKISDPDAPFPYREETLTCTFTIQKGLH